MMEIGGKISVMELWKCGLIDIRDYFDGAESKNKERIDDNGSYSNGSAAYGRQFGISSAFQLRELAAWLKCSHCSAIQTLQLVSHVFVRLQF